MAATHKTTFNTDCWKNWTHVTVLFLKTHARAVVRLTLEEVGEVVKCAVVRVAVPFLESHAVERLQTEGLAFTVHYDDFTSVTVQTRHILQDDNSGTSSSIQN